MPVAGTGRTPLAAEGTRRGEVLNAVVTGVGDVNAAAPRDGYAARIIKLAVPGAELAPLAKEGAARGKVLDAVVILVGYINVSVPRNGYAQGFHTFLAHPWNRQERGAREITDLAVSWLDQHGDRPFFLYLHYMDPHSPYHPEAPFDPGAPRMPGVIREFVEQGECGEVTRRIRNEPGFRMSEIEQRRPLSPRRA